MDLRAAELPWFRHIKSVCELLRNYPSSARQRYHCQHLLSTSENQSFLTVCLLLSWRIPGMAELDASGFAHYFGPRVRSVSVGFTGAAVEGVSKTTHFQNASE